MSNLSGAFSDLALQLLGKQKFDRKRNFLTRIMLNVMFLLKYFTSLFRLYFNFRGVMIGEKHKEFGIKRNQRVLLFGDIFFDKVQKTFTVTRPELVTSSKAKLLRHLQQIYKKKRNLFFLYRGLHLIFLLLAIRRLFKLARFVWKRLKVRLTRPRTKGETSASSGPSASSTWRTCSAASAMRTPKT